jgi:acetyl esterase/lipase
MLIEQIGTPPTWALEPDIAKHRAAWDQHFYAPRLEKAKQHHAVVIEETYIAGVRADVVMPQEGVAANTEDCVLINLHGGAFVIGAGMGGLIESIPIAALTGMKVISLHYRQGPENKFPAASDDVVVVYRELLQQYAPDKIGLYGCSAGGLLAAMAAARIQREQLPRPGAIGILCASADSLFDGDSRYTTPPLTGQIPPPPNQHDLGMMAEYLRGTDANDPMVSPIASSEIIAQFPPTLFVTGTRSGELSSTIHSHTQFIKAGVDARLHIWEGMWHGFFYDVALPESKEALSVIAKFFLHSLDKSFSSAR